MSKPRCELIGTDGNIFSLVGKASITLERAGQRTQAQELRSKIISCESYNAALRLIMEYVDVTESPTYDEDYICNSFDDPCAECGAEAGEPCSDNCPCG